MQLSLRLVTLQLLLKVAFTLLITLVAGSLKCTASSFFSIDSTNCHIDSASIIHPLCNGICSGSISIAASGSGPLFYQWPSLSGVDSSQVSGLCAGDYLVIVSDSTGCVDSTVINIIEPDSIAFSFTVINSSCPGGCTGVLTVIPADTIPYTYQWPGYISTDPFLTNLCLGTYSVIVTNPDGCTETASAFVDYDAPFQLTVTSTPATCLSSCDGTATVVANGIPPFSYQWETGPIQNGQSAFNLCLGSYIINVTDSTGCIVSDTATVALLPPLAITHTSETPTCFGGCDGTAEIFIAAPGNYFYEWSTFPVQDSTYAIGLCSGLYTVNVVDVASGCVFVDTVAVIDPAPPLIQFTVTPSDCENFCTATALVQSNGIPPLNYMWQSGCMAPLDTGLCPGVYAVTVTDSAGCSTVASVSVNSRELWFSTTNSTCNTLCDGSAEALLPPGVWQIEWGTLPVQTTSIATNLCSGSYSISIEDTSGCILTDMVFVDRDEPISTVTTSLPVSCPGTCDGFAAISAAGNTPFTISWNTIPVQSGTLISNLCEGTYVATVIDSLGCTKQDSVMVSGPVPVQFSYLTNPNSCANSCDASAVITPSQPGVYSYEWNTTPLQFGSSATGLCPGYTRVQVTAADGCVYNDSVLIIGPNPIFLSMSATGVSCIGECDGFASCLATGGSTGYNYQWSVGFTSAQALNLCAGMYSITVTDFSGCSQQDSILVTQPDTIVISFSVNDASCSTCSDGSVQAFVNGGTPGYYYFWTPGNLTTDSISNLAPGWYTLCVTDNNSCISCTDVEVSFLNFTHTVATSDSKLLFYPNPFSQNAKLKFNKPETAELRNIEINFFDVAGRKIATLEAGEPKSVNGYVEIDVANDGTEPGIYFFDISADGNFKVSGSCVITTK